MIKRSMIPSDSRKRSAPRSTTCHTMAFILLSILFSFISAAPLSRIPSCPVVLPTHPTSRIVGGRKASPYIRSYIISFSEEGCGGSLLSETWVLTAAHCLVHEGSVARLGGTNSTNGIQIPVKRVINHPAYEFPKNDITLVELESPASSSSNFMALNSNSNIPEDGEFARVAGYGFLGEGSDPKYDAALHQVDVPVMDVKKCIERYFSVNSYLRNDISSDKHLCAGYNRGGCDSCSADSGGPLFVYDEKGSPVQVAIISFGVGCARRVPGGYTRVSTFVPWMKSVGAVFKEKTTRKAVFGDTVGSASGPELDQEKPSNEIEADGEDEEEKEEAVSQPEPEDEGQENPANESNPGPAAGPVPIPSPEFVSTTGTTAPNRPVSQSPTGPQQPDSFELPIRPSPSPKQTPRPSSEPSQLFPEPSLKPSPPTPEHTFGTPSQNKPSALIDSQGGHSGEGRPTTSSNDSNSSNGKAESSDASAGVSGGEIGPRPINEASDDSKGDDVETNGDGQDRDGFVDSTPEDTNADESDSNQSSEGDTPTTPGNEVNLHPEPVEGSQGDGDTEIASQDSEEKDSSDESDSNGDGDSNGDIFGAVLVPGPSPEVLIPPAQESTEDLEELEPSSSPEVSESPEDSNASQSKIGDDDSGLSGLQISMIIVGSIMAIVGIGFIVYFITQKLMKP